ncbi:MinD/ParA family protein [Ureibacillus sinduriensis]|uniref:ATPase n=1 Tax=Ureibacillus sinduriensis BLB-1 = JCM 15800 TaxID=1384057 RepID=A0A0A3HMY4_9BACL|nr:MinD/ParA family protein [Ureibacillus sinduriensis]KGR73911.1 ATPase [Ureibacillus sinduriensis BLB-1 = JCM 15800]
MRDQAENLRLKMLQSQGALGRSIAIVSGKGGVGKSNFSTNFAINLLKLGKKVVVLDMDIGMGNVNILIGKTAQYNLKHYLLGEVSLDQVVYEGPHDLKYISGGSGMSSVMEWSREMIDALLNAFAELQKTYDYILFDMGAGATNWSLDLISAIEEIIVVTTEEPTAITDAYSMMKYIHVRDENKTIYLLCNRAYSKEDGQETLNRLESTMKHFLNKEVILLGSLPEDPAVRKAVREQVPFSIAYPDSNISKTLKVMVQQFVNRNLVEVHGRNKQNTFLSKLRNIFSKGRD